jgi:hypothetical protein
LEEVGEFECADISALCTDFLLEIGDHTLQVFSAEASAEELIPEPFAIEAQAESLSSPVAVKLVEFAHRVVRWFGRRVALPLLGHLKPGQLDGEQMSPEQMLEKIRQQQKEIA